MGELPAGCGADAAGDGAIAGVLGVDADAVLFADRQRFLDAFRDLTFLGLPIQINPLSIALVIFYYLILFIIDFY